MTVILGQCTYYAVLHRIQILELVNEYHVPPRAQPTRRLAIALEQLGSLDHEGVEVHKLAVREELLVLVEQDHVVVLERIVPEPVRRKAREHAAVPLAGPLDAPQHIELVLLVGNAEARLEQHLDAQLAQQLCTECVDGSALDPFGRCSKSRVQPVRDLAGRFVGEGEGANSPGLEAVLVDQETDALDEAERLARARAREHQQRMRIRFDGSQLRWRRCNRR